MGYRVEYSAAADALTNAPEGFDEFFNQRRRWTPSTFANVMDLLGSARRTVKANDNISMLYMLYQGSIFVSSIFGPASIFMMISGSLATVTGLALVWATIIILIPIVAFMLIALLCKQKTQVVYLYVYNQIHYTKVT